MLKVFSKHRLSNFQIIALGYAIMIFVGSVLLSMPFASKSGQPISFIDALFTSTSASCVTGLAVVDTELTWSLAGQIIIIILIQIGGLGFVTIATLFSMIVRRKIGLRERQVMVQSINTSHIGGIIKLTKKIAIGTAIFEGIGAALLSIRFVPQHGFFKGVYYAVFHSISAFCNAGFDLMGEYGAFASLTPYHGDFLVNITIMFLCIIGGIGFLVWDDIYTNKLNFKKYQLHTKIVLVSSAILIFGGAILIYLLEASGTVIGETLPEKILTSLFTSAAARTAGFTVCDIGALSDGSKLISMFLMFVGGSPGSTAGGVKTTSMAVLLVYAIACAKREQNATVFGRNIEEQSLKDAAGIISINFAIVFCGTLIICGFSNISLIAALFEAISALSTGWSFGITPFLPLIPRAIIILLMYFGRVGSMSFALALLEKKAHPPVKAPVEKITVG